MAEALDCADDSLVSLTVVNAKLVPASSGIY